MSRDGDGTGLRLTASEGPGRYWWYAGNRASSISLAVADREEEARENRFSMTSGQPRAGGQSRGGGARGTLCGGLRLREGGELLLCRRG